MACAPSCVADSGASEPRKLPTGVRAAATMTTSCRCQGHGGRRPRSWVSDTPRSPCVAWRERRTNLGQVADGGEAAAADRRAEKRDEAAGRHGLHRHSSHARGVRARALVGGPGASGAPRGADADAVVPNAPDATLTKQMLVTSGEPPAAPHHHGIHAPPRVPHQPLQPAVRIRRRPARALAGQTAGHAPRAAAAAAAAAAAGASAYHVDAARAQSRVMTGTCSFCGAVGARRRSRSTARRSDGARHGPLDSDRLAGVSACLMHMLDVVSMAAPASDEEDAVQRRIAALLADPLLADVPPDVTLAEARALAALETGQAMQVTVVRLDGVRIGTMAPRLGSQHAPGAHAARPQTDARRLPSVDLVVRQGATVKELKRFFALAFARRPECTRSISWCARAAAAARPRCLWRARSRPCVRCGSGCSGSRRYIWRRYALACDHTKLEPDTARILDLGVRSGSELHFVRRRRDKPRRAGKASAYAIAT